MCDGGVKHWHRHSHASRWKRTSHSPAPSFPYNTTLSIQPTSKRAHTHPVCIGILWQGKLNIQQKRSATMFIIILNLYIILLIFYHVQVCWASNLLDSNVCTILCQLLELGNAFSAWLSSNSKICSIQKQTPIVAHKQEKTRSHSPDGVQEDKRVGSQGSVSHSLPFKFLNHTQMEDRSPTK